MVILEEGYGPDREGVWWVSLNTGGHLEDVVWDHDPPPHLAFQSITHVARAPRTWAGGTDGTSPESNRFRHSMGSDERVAISDLMDMNGDGFLDRVVVQLDANDEPTGQWRAYLGRQFPAVPQVGIESFSIPRPHLLASMGNEMGGVSSIFFDRSTLYDHADEDGAPRMPFVQWLVSATRLNDGRCTPGQWINVLDPAENPCIEDANGVGHEIITKYHYEGGLLAVEDDGFEMIEREFRGFRRVSAVSTSGFTTTYFHQSDGREGRVQAVETWSLSPTWQLEKVAEVEKLWDLVPHPHNPSRQLVYLQKQTMSQFDLGAANPKISVSENVVVDGWGRVLQSARYGLAGGVQQDRVDSFLQYASQQLPDFRPLDKPSAAYTQAGGAILEYQVFQYDGASTPGGVASGNLTKIVSWNDQPQGTDAITTMGYDAYGNLGLVLDPNGHATVYNYDDGQGTHLFPLVTTRYNGSTPFASVTVVDYKTGQTWAEWGPGGQMTAFGDPDNTILRSFDAAGRPVCEALPGDGLVSNCTVKTTYAFADGSPGSLSSVTVDEKWDTNSNRRKSQSYFDGLGRPVRTEVEAIVGNASAVSKVVHDDVEYNRDGRVLRRFYPYPQSSPRVNGAVELDYHLNGSTHVDPLGRVHKKSFPDGKRVLMEYHGVDTITYDQMDLKTVSTVDSFDRVIATKTFAAGSGTPYTVNESQYDALGRLTDVLQNGIQLKHMKYDSLGRKYWMSDQDSGSDTVGSGFGVWRYYYDPAGNLVVQDDPKANQHIQFVYDDLNRLVKKCYMNIAYSGGAATCPQGPARESMVTYTYDKPQDPHGRGRLWYVDHEAGLTEIGDYDTRGQVRSVLETIDVGLDAILTEAQFLYAYTNSGEVRRVDYPGDDGEYVVTEFNGVGQPKGLASYTGAAVLKDRYVQAVEYDAFGRATLLRHSNGQEASGQPPNYQGVEDRRSYYGKLKMFRLSGINVRKGSTNHLNLENFEYNARGQVTEIEDTLHATVLTNTAGYVYDEYGRLDLWWNGHTGVEQYDYDTMGNITKKGPPGAQLTFGYDSSKRPHRLMGVEGLPGGPKALQYDRNGNRTLSHDGQQYQYDHEDRLTRITMTGGPVAFYYDQDGGQRARIVKDGMVGQERITRYFSDLVHTTHDGKTVRRYFLGSTLIASREIASTNWQVGGGPSFGDPGSGVEFAAAGSAGSHILIVALGPGAQAVAAAATTLLLLSLLLLPKTKRRVIGLRLRHGQVVVIVVLFVCGSTPWPLLLRPASGQPPAETVRHYHTDHLGSIQLVTDEDGNIEEQIRYFPYGKVRGRFTGSGAPLPAPSGDSVRYEFTGHETELNSGLINAGARFLDPLTASFLTHDPAAQYLNPYCYGPWDPANGTDPTGMILGTFFGWVFANLWWVAPVAGAVASFAQSLANGASFGQALGAAAVGATIGLVTGGILGGIGQGITSEVLKNVYAVALIGSGVGTIAQGAAEGQYITAGVGAALLALGLVAGFSQGGNGAGGGRGGVTLEEMEALYDAKFTPAQTRQSSSWSDYFQVRAPDGDGYLTLGEARWQWQNGQGAPVSVDATTLDFSGLRVSDFPGGPGSTHAFRFQNAQDFLVHGTVTTELHAGSAISVRPDTYNFDIKPWRSGAFGRNFETLVSRYLVHGPGVPYEIRFRGTVPIAP